MNHQLTKEQVVDENILYKYDLIVKLGSGAYGHVWKVMNKIQNKQYALKKIFSAFQNELDSQRTYREISLLHKIKHTNIIELKQVIRAKNDLDLYLVFQLKQSDLYKANKGNYLNLTHKKYIIYQMAICLKYLHSGGVIHRDIKPSNILIDQNCKISLCDFGLSRTLYAYQGIQPVITEFIATRWYRAPEVVFGSKSYTTKSDIWSFGCLIYQIYAKKALFPGKDNIDQISKILQFNGYPTTDQKQTFRVNTIQKILSHFSIDMKPRSEYFSCIQDLSLKKLLTQIFEYNHQKRPSAQQILNSEFLQQFKGYENQQTICTSPIHLQHNQNIKLNSSSYKNLIYTLFINESKQQLKPTIQKQIVDLKTQQQVVKQTEIFRKQLDKTSQPNNIQTKHQKYEQNQNKSIIKKDTSKRLLIKRQVKLNSDHHKSKNNSFIKLANNISYIYKNQIVRNSVQKETQNHSIFLSKNQSLILNKSKSIKMTEKHKRNISNQQKLHQWQNNSNQNSILEKDQDKENKLNTSLKKKKSVIFHNNLLNDPLIQQNKNKRSLNTTPDKSFSKKLKNSQFSIYTNANEIEKLRSKKTRDIRRSLFTKQYSPYNSRIFHMSPIKQEIKFPQLKVQKSNQKYEKVKIESKDKKSMNSMWIQVKYKQADSPRNDQRIFKKSISNLQRHKR